MIFNVIVIILLNAFTGVEINEYDAGWKDEYISFINNKIENDKMYEEYYYTLVDINNDLIPELYIAPNYGIGGDIICSYYNGKLIYEQIGVGDGYFRYIKGENLFIESGGRMDVYSDKAYSIENGKFVVKFDGRYGAGNVENLEFDQYGEPIYEYFIDEVQVSDEKEYKEKLNAVFDEQRAIAPIYSNSEYDSEVMRYVGEGIYDGKEILEAIDNYGTDNYN